MTLIDCFILSLALFIVAFAHQSLIVVLAIALLVMGLVRLAERLKTLP